MKKVLSAANRKFVSLFCAALLMGSALTACGESSKAQTAVTSGETADTAATEAETTDDSATARIKSEMKGVDLGGMEFSILGKDDTDSVSGVVSNEIDYAEENGEPLQDAVYNRNRLTESLLDVSIKMTVLSDVTKTLIKSVAAGDSEYDAALDSVMSLGTPARQGNFKNFYKISSIDLTQSWWDQDNISSYSLFGSKLYWLNGDINYRNDYGECVLFFNKSIATNYGFEQPYDLVDAGTWDLDHMIAMANSFTQDLDGDGKMSIKADAYGLGDNSDIMKHMIYSIGEKITENGTDGVPKMAEMTDEHVTKVQKLYDTISGSQSIYIGDNIAEANALIDGRLMIYLECLGAYSEFRTMEDDFGILPLPKYDEAQERYMTYVSNGWNTAYVVPVTNTDFEKTGQILETMAGFSTDTIRTALLNVLFDVKYARDEQTARMVNMIINSKVFDWSTDFGWLNDLTGCYTSLTKSKTFDFVSRIEKVTDKVNATIDSMVSDFQAIE